MRTIIIGYRDEQGGSQPSLICGPHVESADQSRVIEDAANRQRFPKGIKRLEYFTIPDEPAQIAIFLGADVGAAIEAAEERNARAEEQRLAARQKIEAAGSKLAAAEAKVKSTARSRNELMGKLHQAQTSLRNHELTSEHLRGESWSKNIAELKKLILGDPKEKVAGLEEQVKTAIAAYDAAVKEFNAVAKPFNDHQPAPAKSQMAQMNA